ncbi:MAG TPA: preprotein translocase subunit SecA [Candidatus Moranbacteria bacterium]|nr:preprotein translocase subunit SecA [Candidatus Moranbacteria bacterium]
MSIISKLFGSNEREVAKTRPIVEKINSFEAEISRLSDEELKNKTAQFRERIKNNETLDEILPEAFAVVREGVKRSDGKRLFDVQLMGGIILHQGRIAEMKTGEGKTHTALLPMYLNALSGKGVHIITVNDYLAKRDCNWMGGILHFLGISTACIIHDASYIYEPKILDKNEVSVEMQNLKEVSRRDAYNADITYGTNNEFGFDYLRDNMVQSFSQMSQRELNFAIVDEVDSILIDEARTPLIISAPDSESTKMYQQFASLVPRLKRGEDFEVDEKMKAVSITDSGISKIEGWLGMGNIYESGKINYVHHLEQALKAEIIFQKDRDYVVKDGEVIIVDDFTGRIMPGRRYSEGLHQAIEAKEHVQVQKESRTLATITFQNYFRMYNKLSGMTGTANTSAEEFFKVYNIDVVEIPTNKPMIRKDLPDIVYKSEKGKFDAICEKIKEINKIGQPVLVGTIAIEKSEYLSALLTRFGVAHEVLNAKQHEKEALIIQNAGQLGSVTIATNMAGRGTDIKLGEGVKEVGGLFILGTERHEARRIDNQLRGRAGRQGDPGMSQFFVSLEDELMRRFGGDKLISMMDTLGLPEDQPIQNKIISRTIENAQSKIEGFNFDIRKHVLEYDDVMNKQREVIYKKRKEILGAPDLKNEMLGYMTQEMENLVSFHSAEEKFDTHEIFEGVRNIILVEKVVEKKLEEIKNNNAKNSAEKISAMTEYLIGLVKEAYNKKEQEMGLENMRNIEKAVVLQTTDMMWMNHLDEMDYLRDGIGLRGYGQRDPLIEYKREAYLMFSHLLNNIHGAVVRTIFKVSLVVPENSQTSKQKNNLNYSGGGEVQQFSSAKQESGIKNQESGNKEEKKSLPIVNKDKVGRNDPCPCGSGKKYKKCCGK